MHVAPEARRDNLRQCHLRLQATHVYFLTTRNKKPKKLIQINKLIIERFQADFIVLIIYFNPLPPFYSKLKSLVFSL